MVIASTLKTWAALALTAALAAGLVAQTARLQAEQAAHKKLQLQVAKDERDRAQAKAREAKRADQAAAQYLIDHLDQQARYDAIDATYQDLRNRAPLVVRRPAAACAAAPAPADALAVAQPADSGDLRLTLAAVRMWNGALAGRDSPAGACGAAGAAPGADAACAEDAGVTLDDAFANHAINARSCALDRQRYQALIDFLNNFDDESDTL